MIMRKLTAKDYDALIRLWNDAGLPYKPQGRDKREDIENQLKQPNTLYLIAEVDNVIVGSILGTHDSRKGWINRLAVSPSHRRKGLAKRLVKEVENRFSELGIDIMACMVEDWNTMSLEVFERLGYTRHPDIIYLSKRKNPGV
ncbi:MAG: GNAT family N-acetyltransferase [Candidatus Hodarchaeota archaeon]